MRFAHTFRRVSPILLLAGGFVSSLVVAGFIRHVFATFGDQYPSTLFARLPISTQFLLKHFQTFASVPIHFAGVAIMLVVVATLRSSTPEVRNLYLTMIAALLYLASFALLVSFVLMFFVLPETLASVA